eukprot:s3239_g12.t1
MGKLADRGQNMPGTAGLQVEMRFCICMDLGTKTITRFHGNLSHRDSKKLSQDLRFFKRLFTVQHGEKKGLAQLFSPRPPLRTSECLKLLTLKSYPIFY